MTLLNSEQRTSPPPVLGTRFLPPAPGTQVPVEAPSSCTNLSARVPTLPAGQPALNAGESVPHSRGTQEALKAPGVMCPGGTMGHPAGGKLRLLLIRSRFEHGGIRLMRLTALRCKAWWAVRALIAV